MADTLFKNENFILKKVIPEIELENIAISGVGNISCLNRSQMPRNTLWFRGRRVADSTSQKLVLDLTQRVYSSALFFNSDLAEGWKNLSCENF